MRCAAVWHRAVAHPHGHGAAATEVTEVPSGRRRAWRRAVAVAVAQGQEAQHLYTFEMSALVQVGPLVVRKCFHHSAPRRCRQVGGGQWAVRRGWVVGRASSARGASPHMHMRSPQRTSRRHHTATHTTHTTHRTLRTAHYAHHTLHTTHAHVPVPETRSCGARPRGKAKQR